MVDHFLIHRGDAGPEANWIGPLAFVELRWLGRVCEFPTHKLPRVMMLILFDGYLFALR